MEQINKLNNNEIEMNMCVSYKGTFMSTNI